MMRSARKPDCDSATYRALRWFSLQPHRWHLGGPRTQGGRQTHEMTNQTTFETSRLLLRPRTCADLPACLAMDRDPEVTRFIDGPWSDPGRHEDFVRKRMAADFGQDLGYWSIFAREQPSRFLGWVFLIPCDGAGPDLEIGWRLVKEAWGRGYATEAAKRILEHGLQKVGPNRIIAEIDPRNEGSVKLALKIGMQQNQCLAEDGRTDYLFAATR